MSRTDVIARYAGELQKIYDERTAGDHTFTGVLATFLMVLAADELGHVRPGSTPPEPPVGTWVRDRHGGLSMRQEGGWGEPGIMPFGKWEAMWEARGPYVVCGPWGAPL